MLFSAFLFTMCDTCVEQKVIPGAIDKDRIYENKQLGISFRVPDDWTLMGNYSPEITVSEFFTLDNEGSAAAQLFSLVKPDTSKSTDEMLRDFSSSIAFVLVRSGTKDSKGDRDAFKDAVRDQYSMYEDFMALNKENLDADAVLKLRNGDIPAYKNSAVHPDKSSMVHSVVGFRNFDCIGLIIEYKYSTHEQMEEIERILREVEIKI